MSQSNDQACHRRLHWANLTKACRTRQHPEETPLKAALIAALAVIALPVIALPVAAFA